MDREIVLGIDTSNYTTSCAVCNLSGNVLLNHKLPLPVAEGQKGLRQSDAVFHHVKNLQMTASVTGEWLKEHDGYKITAVGYSKKPRDADGSYMPCFLAGTSVAEYSSGVLGVPAYPFSHQAGHVMAATSSACRINGLDINDYLSRKFIAFHVSGGTTDVLLCEPEEETIFQITQIGGTKDINGGQAIDRTGVLMGLTFPCGAEMDKSALSYEKKIQYAQICVNGTYCNLSGLENKAAELYKKTEDIAETSAFTLDFIARTLEKITLNAFDEYGKLPVIYAGGVMSSLFIRKRLLQYGHFAEPQFSSDNAAGVALLAAEMYKRNKWSIENE